MCELSPNIGESRWLACCPSKTDSNSSTKAPSTKHRGRFRGFCLQHLSLKLPPYVQGDMNLLVYVGLMWAWPKLIFNNSQC
jgi:hypothetical protein